MLLLLLADLPALWPATQRCRRPAARREAQDHIKQHAGSDGSYQAHPVLQQVVLLLQHLEVLQARLVRAVLGDVAARTLPALLPRTQPLQSGPKQEPLQLLPQKKQSKLPWLL